jgi:mono/diheme cytochrome c family protein
MSTRTLRPHALSLCAAALAAALMAAPARAEDDPGRAAYLRYCGACHGPNGKGDGIAGSLMIPKPIDLTQIAKNNGGEFPLQKVVADIDGTMTVRAHGDPVMPVWGEVFKAEPGWEMSRRAEVRAKITLIANYVRSLQEH